MAVLGHLLRASGLTDLLKSIVRTREHRMNCGKTTKTVFPSKLEDKNTTLQEKGGRGGAAGAQVTCLGLRVKLSRQVPRACEISL